jgi:hypothetical protein
VGTVLSDGVNKYFLAFCVVFMASVRELNCHTCVSTWFSQFCLRSSILIFTDFIFSSLLLPAILTWSNQVLQVSNPSLLTVFFFCVLSEIRLH